MNAQRCALPLLLVTFTALAGGYSVAIPLGEAPDEVSHWSYVQYLTMHWHLPVPEGPVTGEAHQPPLYYLIGALISSWVPNHQFDVSANPDWAPGNPQIPNLLLHTRQEAFPYRGSALAWHLVRLVLVILGVITVWATYQLALELFPENQWVALTAATFVAFLPQFTFLSAVVNNDNLVITLSALSLLVLLHSARDPRPIIFCMLGILLGLAILAKASAFTLWASSALVMLLRRACLPIGKRLASIIFTFVVAVTVASPWIIYNAVASGDPLGFARMLQGFARPQAMTWSDWMIYGERMYWSFWGKFGGATNIGMPLAVYGALTLLLVIGLAGDLLMVKDWRANRLPVTARQGMLSFGLFWVLLVASHLRLESTMLGIDQARQLFPALPALSVLIAAGVLRLARKPAVPALIVVCGMGLIGFTNASAVASAYAPARQLASVTSPSSTSMDFGEQIRVLDFRIDTSRVTPGHAVVVELQWQALTDLTENYWLLLQLDNSAGPVASQDGVPSGGRLTTDWWQKGQVFTSRHALIVPDVAAPGTYTLRLGLHPYGKWEWLPIRGDEMLPLGKIEITRAP
jgi:4-amino-4-deoxy-L-arabinose transferase-like glycosyltransferase